MDRTAMDLDDALARIKDALVGAMGEVFAALKYDVLQHGEDYEDAADAGGYTAYDESAVPSERIAFVAGWDAAYAMVSADLEAAINTAKYV